MNTSALLGTRAHKPRVFKLTSLCYSVFTPKYFQSGHHSKIMSVCSIVKTLHVWGNVISHWSPFSGPSLTHQGLALMYDYLILPLLLCKFVTGQWCHTFCTYCFRWAQFTAVGSPQAFQSYDTVKLTSYLREHKGKMQTWRPGIGSKCLALVIRMKLFENLIQLPLTHKHCGFLYWIA